MNLSGILESNIWHATLKKRTKHSFTVDNLGLSTVNFRLRTTISIVNNF